MQHLVPLSVNQVTYVIRDVHFWLKLNAASWLDAIGTLIPMLPHSWTMSGPQRRVSLRDALHGNHIPSITAMEADQKLGGLALLAWAMDVDAWTGHNKCKLSCSCVSWGGGKKAFKTTGWPAIDGTFGIQSSLGCSIALTSPESKTRQEDATDWTCKSPTLLSEVNARFLPVFPDLQLGVVDCFLHFRQIFQQTEISQGMSWRWWANQRGLWVISSKANKSTLLLYVFICLFCPEQNLLHLPEHGARKQTALMIFIGD